MLPMSRGGEAGWSRFVGTDGAGPTRRRRRAAGLAPLILKPPFDFASSRWPTSARCAQRLRGDVRGQGPDLAAFFASGGKLLLWHGESDPGPSPVGTNDYVRAVLAAARRARQQLRYFLLPGTEHCGGGPGASRVAWLDTLENWDEAAARPRWCTAAARPMVRPHCAWPNVARYRGSGDANDPRAGSACRAPRDRAEGLRRRAPLQAKAAAASPGLRQCCGGCGGSRTRRRAPHAQRDRSSDERRHLNHVHFGRTTRGATVARAADWAQAARIGAEVEAMRRDLPNENHST
jgi:hypothetical protein